MRPDPVAEAEKASARLSAEALTPQEARLYSQFTRMLWGGASLKWDSEAELAHLMEAVRLIHCAQTIRESGGDRWERPLLRAAELFEWLAGASRDEPRPRLRAISSAAYQLSGYPARARSLLPNATPDGGGDPLSPFLRSDFVGLQEALLSFWGSAYHGIQSVSEPSAARGGSDAAATLPTRLSAELAAALGVLSAEVRWGGVPRLEAALEKLRALSNFQLLGEQPDAWLLSHLIAEVGRRYATTSVRKSIAPLMPLVGPEGAGAMERYARASVIGGRALTWPSQQKGIERLAEGGSFALCTPTGSGKTLIAELAIIVGLFGAASQPAKTAPLILYLSPSRALAAEVESRLAQVVRSIRTTGVQVTGLYGGTDWGPTDAWLSTESPSVVICTHEKAEALIRYLGRHILDRLSLLVVDEVHSVQQGDDVKALAQGESRALRLEALLSRVFRDESSKDLRVIGLSAVAQGFESSLSQWIAGSPQSAEGSGYRSTRQLIGRLECSDDCSFEIRYDLLNGQSLEFEETAAREVPFIPHPFASRPPAPSFDLAGPEKSLRPSALWAAIQFSRAVGVAPGKSVLISVNQKISTFANDLLRLLSEEWAEETKQWFKAPSGGIRGELWEKGLAACDDYFGSDAIESQLFRRGVLLHHGGLPPPVSRAFLKAIEARVVPIIVATSTLSEGVNLPVDVVLVPSLMRGGQPLTPQEFLNLSGRAGRPGFALEGQTLVLVHARGSQEPGKGRGFYNSLIRGIRSPSRKRDGEGSARSPLASLLEIIWLGWKQASDSDDPVKFLEWLEATAPAGKPTATALPAAKDLAEPIDSLDGVLLPMVVESERAFRNELSPTDLESALKQYWAKTYAHVALAAEGPFEKMFIRRGSAIRFRHYVDSGTRRRIYRSGLSPRWAEVLIKAHPRLVEHLRTGREFAAMSPTQRVSYIDTTLGYFEEIGPLKWRSKKLGRLETLHWWLDPNSAPSKPEPTEVAAWFEAVNQNFTYRAAWGLGSAAALSLDAVAADQDGLPSLDDWPRSGLPWGAFWIKELLACGTIEPVAAYALTKKIVTARAAGSRLAYEYFGQADRSDLDAVLDPRRIRDWVSMRGELQSGTATDPPRRIEVDEINASRVVVDSTPRVWPVVADSCVVWVDVAGYPVARSAKSSTQELAKFLEFDFVLNAPRRQVELDPYV